MENKRKDPNQMTFLEHLGELRKRLLYSLASIVLAFLICFYVSDMLFHYATLPIQQQLSEGEKLIGTGVAEAFSARMLISAITAVIVSSPFWFYELWLFISPGLYPHEKRIAIPFVFFTALFFIGGALFCYFAVLPVGFRFFLEQYERAGLVAQIKISQYFSFFSRMMLAFGLCFEMPIIAFFFGKLRIINYKMLLKWARYAVLVIFILAAVLTPGPDVASQLLLAGPLLAMYGLSILVVALTSRAEKSPATHVDKTE